MLSLESVLNKTIINARLQWHSRGSRVVLVMPRARVMRGDSIKTQSPAGEITCVQNHRQLGALQLCTTPWQPMHSFRKRDTRFQFALLPEWRWAIWEGHLRSLLPPREMQLHPTVSLLGRNQAVLCPLGHFCFYPLTIWRKMLWRALEAGTRLRSLVTLQNSEETSCSKWESLSE